MQIKELAEKSDIEKTAEILVQIYPDLKLETYVTNVLSMMKNGYKLAAVFEDENVDNGRCIGVIGVRILDKLQYGRTLEVEDFMICRKRRGVGVGKMLIRWIEWQAMNFDCNSINCSLNSDRIESHKIFSREHFILDGFKFSK